MIEKEALIVKNLTKKYGNQTAVNDISFSISRGEIFGLLGPNGAGKSTTISMLAGLIKPTSGLVNVMGMDLYQHPNTIKAMIGLVPQELALYPTLSARDNLLFFGRIYGLKGKILGQRVDQVLEMVRLTERAKEPVNTYSGGMKRRVNMAAGLLHQPDLLFLDEPTVGIDPQSRNAIFESIEALNRAGLTIIYTTHYMEEAERLCQRVAIIDYGKFIALDTPANLIRQLGNGHIRLEIADGKLDQVKTRAGQLMSVSGITLKDHKIDLKSDNPQKTLLEVLQITNQIDARVTALQIMEANLETVFLSLTGKALRE